MADIFPSSLHLRTLEQKQVAFMLATGFFMGVFIATYQVTADSLFLNRLGEYLDKAFLITGILGIISTGVFSFLQNFIRFSVLTVLVVAGILVFTIVVYTLLHFGDPAWQNTVVFAMFCSSGPIIALLFLSYWGTFGRLFNFRQSKSIIGWIDTGQLVAAIIASFLIPLSARLVPDTTDYLMVCAVSILVVGILLTIISGRFTLAKNDPREFDSEVRRETSLTRMFSDRYVLLLSMLLGVSMTVFILNQFSFQEMVRVQYPNQRELTDFNAFFIGAVYAMSLVMQTFVNNKIISNYGLRVSLYLLPSVLLVLSIGSAITGYFFGFDKVTSPAGFVYFFLFVAMSRLFNWTLRDSLENPVFKLFFIPLDSRIRFNVQAKVEGLVNESSRFLAGILIFGLALIPAFEVIHISLFLMVLAGGYFFVVNKLYQGYRNKIRVKLEGTEWKQDKLEKGFSRITKKLEEMLTWSHPGKAVFSFKFLEKLSASQTAFQINSLIKSPDESIRYYGQERMNEMKGLSVSDRYVVRLDPEKINPSEKSLLAKIDLQLLVENGGNITRQRIQRLARSPEITDRQYGAELLLHTESEDCLTFLVDLLNDSDAKVRMTAIKTAIRKNNQEVIGALIENLAHPVFSNQAMNTLVLIGVRVLPALDAAFYRSGQSTMLMLRTVEAMGRISGQRAKEMLWSKIDYPNKVVVSQVLLALGECGFKANVSQVTRIKYAIDSDIADIRWNLSAIQEIGSEGFNDQIVRSLKWEIQNDIEHIYMLLAMLYDTRSIQLVKENLDSGTAEGITYAVELLDVFLSDQLKQRVIPVLDDISDADRISRLDIFYPRIKFDSKIVLKFIINRDFTQSNRWTKSCVLYQIGLQQVTDFKLDLIAHMFNPDKLIREVAGWALYQINPDEYHTHAARLGAEVKKRLDEIVLTPKLSDFGKVLFFQRIPVFTGVPGITLSRLADISEQVNLKKDERLVLDEKTNNSFYVMVYGEVDFYLKGSLKATFTEGQFIGELISQPLFINTNLIMAKDEVSLLRINKDLFYELLSDDVLLADKVLDFV
jgi:ATP:ADP antiporter, AAA family